VSSIFDEVDEEVRREKLQKFWERYRTYIIGAAILIVLLVGGWRLYEWWQAKQAAAAGVAFEAAMTLSGEGKHAEAEAAFAKISEEAPRSYRDLSRLQAATELAQRDPKAAVEAFDAIAADQRLSETLRDLAALRAGLLLVDSAPFEEVRRRLEPLATPDRTFRNTARELLALSAWRAGDLAAAQKWFDMIMADAEASPEMRRRVEMLMALATANRKS
jgi:hypothetical protein